MFVPGAAFETGVVAVSVERLVRLRGWYEEKEEERVRQEGNGFGVEGKKGKKRQGSRDTRGV